MWTEQLKTAALVAGWGDAFGHWKGIEVLKHPNDLLSIQEIIHETGVDLVVETGTWKGGSAHYYGDLGVDVLSVDKAPAKTPPPHPNVEYLRGSSTSPRTLYLVNQACIDRRVMVLLDSDHAKANVAAELEAYAPLVAPGCYLIVEDTALGRELRDTIHDDGDGPADALEAWLPAHPEFKVDLHRERFGPTMNPGGYLLRT
jgi:cephalosporin hydroxylase